MIKNWNDYDQQSSSNGQDTQTPIQQETKPQVKVQVQQIAIEKYKFEERKKFLTDQEIIAQIQNGKVDNKNIRIVQCKQQEAKKYLQQHKAIIKLNEYRQNSYVATFTSKSDLINFIKQKIQNQPRFYLQGFISKPKPQRQNRHQQKYQKKDKYDKTQKNKYKYIPKQKQQTTLHKNKELFHNFQWKQSQLHIKNQTAKILNILNSISDNNILNQFTKIRIFVPKSIIKFGEQVSQAIQKKYGWHEINKNSEIQNRDLIQIILQQQKKQIKSQNFYEKKKYQKKQDNRQKSNKYIEKNSHSKQTKQNIRRLNKNSQEYFCQIQLTNINQICDQFESIAFVQLFNNKSAEIFSKWNVWIIQSYEKNIKKLLEISWTLKKQSGFSIKYNIGSKENKPQLKIQIRQGVQNKDKAKEYCSKVDTSYINSYLNNS